MRAEFKIARVRGGSKRIRGRTLRSVEGEKWVEKEARESARGFERRGGEWREESKRAWRNEAQRVSGRCVERYPQAVMAEVGPETPLRRGGIAGKTFEKSREGWREEKEGGRANRPSSFRRIGVASPSLLQTSIPLSCSTKMSSTENEYEKQRLENIRANVRIFPDLLARSFFSFLSSFHRAHFPFLLPFPLPTPLLSKLFSTLSSSDQEELPL